MKASTVRKADGSTVGSVVKWNVIKATSATYFDVNGVDAGKMILLVAISSTKTAGGSRYVFIGTSATADSASTKLAFSAGGIGRGKFSLSVAGDSFWKIDSRDAGTSGKYSITMIGPLESARYKDTAGRIKVSVPTGGTTSTFITAIAIP